MKPLKKEPKFKNPAVEAVAKAGSIKPAPKPKKKGK
jgi:hypothetical protein